MRGAAAYVLDVARRYGACTLLVLAVLVAGLVTGSLWRGVDEGDARYDDVAHGLPALQDGGGGRSSAACASPRRS